jgi:hypothetical protein
MEAAEQKQVRLEGIFGGERRWWEGFKPGKKGRGGDWGFFKVGSSAYSGLTHAEEIDRWRPHG